MSTDIKSMSTPDLVALYNKLTKKSIKKFSSREAGEKQVLKAIEASEKGEAKTATKLAKDPKKRAEADRSAAISATWKDSKVAASRKKRTNVEVDGKVYRSVPGAFKALKLDGKKMQQVRAEVVKQGKATFDGHTFKAISAETYAKKEAA